MKTSQHLRKIFVITSLAILFGLNNTCFAQSLRTYVSNAELETLIQNKINQMTLDEKEKMCYGNGSMDGGKCDRLGIGALKMCDGPLGAKRSTPSTGFGSGMIMAQTWNADLIHQAGVVLGEETNGGGGDVLLGPGINIIRDLVGGRTFEYLTEDPFLNGKLAAQYVLGVQSQGVAATIKHFIANNQENNREGASSNMSERTLREVYLPGYETAIKEGNAWAVMTGCNLINGVECAGVSLLQNVLKNEYGFKGVTLTDWSGIVGHSTESAATGGMDISMPNATVFGNLAEAVTKGTLNVSVLDEMVRRILRVSYWTGVSGWGPASPAGTMNTVSHKNVTRLVADEGIVLLKNNGNILPLSKTVSKNICITGRNVTAEHCGGGGSSNTPVPNEINPLEGLQNLGGLTLNYQATQAGAVAAARTADVTIVVTGFQHAEPYTGGDTEGSDRTNLKFPAEEIKLINAVAAVSNKVIVVVIGGPEEIRDWVDNVEAVVYAAYPGMEGGNALANILYGNINPSGKLTISWPKRDEDQPSFSTRNAYSTNYKEGIYVGYKGYEKNKVVPEFAFGHGLSYTTFQYSNLTLSKSTYNNTDSITVNVDVKNTGSKTGKEIVQLYVKDPESTIDKPIKELKGFNKVSLLPNETKTVTFTLDSRSFSSWYKGFGWYSESGEYDILVGSASDDIRLTDKISLINSVTPPAIVADTIPALATNLALNKPVTVSSTQTVDYPASNAVDGIFSSRWSSATGKTTPEWIYVDLQQTYKITGVSLNWETASAKMYRIQVSSDAINWSNVYVTSNGDGGTDDIRDLSAIGRYVRMYGLTKNYPEYGYSLYEFAIFGTPVSALPYGGTKWTIPGKIEAENYDTGGEGVAFHETTVGNIGAEYRTDNVDIQTTTDTDGGYNICTIATGEWLKYSVFIPNPGFYTLEMRVARQTEGNTNLHVECDGNDITGSMTVPGTGGWQTWTTIKKTGIYLNTINQIIKLCFDGNDLNVNWIKFIPDTTAAIPTTQSRKLTFYPNPVTDKLSIKMDKSRNADYTITNITGQVVLKDKILGSTANVDMSSMKSGIYFIHVNGSEFGKIIKR